MGHGSPLVAIETKVAAISRKMNFFKSTLGAVLIVCALIEIQATEVEDTNDDGAQWERENSIELRLKVNDVGLQRGSWSERGAGSGASASSRMNQEGRSVRDTFNFYNSRPAQNRPYNRPLPYDDAEDMPSYQPPYHQPYRNPYAYPPQPYYPISPTPPPAPPSTTAAGALSPIGYMLIDTYNTPRGSFSRPRAFFKI